MRRRESLAGHSNRAILGDRSHIVVLARVRLCLIFIILGFVGGHIVHDQLGGVKLLCYVCFDSFGLVLCACRSFILMNTDICMLCYIFGSIFSGVFALGLFVWDQVLGSITGHIFELNFHEIHVLGLSPFFVVFFNILWLHVCNFLFHLFLRQMLDIFLN